MVSPRLREFPVLGLVRRAQRSTTHLLFAALSFLFLPPSPPRLTDSLVRPSTSTYKQTDTLNNENMNENPLSRTAIALNNMGVELLHKRCYSQAANTFYDASRAIKDALAGKHHDWQFSLKLAELRCCRPQPVECDAVSLMPLMTDPKFLSSMERPAPFYTIRISDVDAACFQNSTSLHTCIILYNAGLAHYLLTSRRKGPSMDSVSMLHLAYHVLQETFGNEQDTELFKISIYIRIAIVQCLAHATPTVREKCQTLWNDLRMVACELHQCTEQIYVSHSAAAG